MCLCEFVSGRGGGGEGRKKKMEKKRREEEFNLKTFTFGKRAIERAAPCSSVNCMLILACRHSRTCMNKSIENVYIYMEDT